MYIINHWMKSTYFEWWIWGEETQSQLSGKCKKTDINLCPRIALSFKRIKCTHNNWNHQWRKYGPAGPTAVGAQTKRGPFSSHIGQDGPDEGLGTHFWDPARTRNLKLHHWKSQIDSRPNHRLIPDPTSHLFQTEPQIDSRPNLRLIPDPTTDWFQNHP